MAGTRRAPGEKRLTVLYDGDCGLCSLIVQLLRELDLHGRLEFVPLQHARRHFARQELAAAAEQYPLAESIHVMHGDGRLSAGGDALLDILEMLPAGRLFRPWRWLPGLPALLELAYGAVARRRGAISQLIARLGGPPPTCDLHPPAAAAVGLTVPDGAAQATRHAR